MHGMQVRSLVRKLRFHMPQSQKPKTSSSVGQHGVRRRSGAMQVCGNGGDLLAFWVLGPACPAGWWWNDTIRDKTKKTRLIFTAGSSSTSHCPPSNTLASSGLRNRQCGLYTWRSWGPERLRNLSFVKQLEKSRLQIQVLTLQSPAFRHCNRCQKGLEIWVNNQRSEKREW